MTITVYPPLGSSSDNPITIAYGGMQTDAFGRLRVSNQLTVFDSQNRYAADPQFDTALSGSGSTSYLANESTVQLSVTTTSGDQVVRQSFRSFPYQPGKSLLVLATFVMNEGKENLRQRVGYFNTQNGVFFQQSGTTKSFVLRSYTSGSVDDTRTVNQDSWNGDKLDGSGPSGITLTPSNAQILFMDFEWLGVGSVRCGFVINGEFIVCHTFHNANSINSVYMTTAILPVRYEITNTGTTGSSSSMKQICSSVMSEGGYQRAVAEQVARRTTALATISTTFLPLISIRLNSGSLGAVVLPQRVNVLPETTQLYEIALFKNPTLTGASYNTGTFNNVDYDVSATAMSGGTIVQQDYITSSAQTRATLLAPTGYNFQLQLGVSLAGVSDVYTVGIRTVSGATTGDAFGSLSFYDLTD